MDKRSISKLFFTIMIKMLNNFAIQRWSVDPEFDSGEPVFTTLKPKKSFNLKLKLATHSTMNHGP
jgi:hypothetical protein